MPAALPPRPCASLHECRVTAEDDLFVATLRPARDLELLDVAALLDEPRGVTELENLDLALNMLFLAGDYSYPIARELAREARFAGFDGMVIRPTSACCAMA